MSKIQTWQALKFHWILWKICGLQPPKRDSKWFKPYIVYAIFLNATTTLLFPITLIVNMIHSENFTDLCQNLYMTTTDVICNIKFINVFIIRQKLLSVRQILERLDARAKTSEEVATLNAGIISARKCFITFSRLCACVVVSSQVMVYLSTERILMYPAWFPWDWRASKPYFLCAHFYQFYGLVVQILQNIANDTYPQAYLVILASHIKALALRIKALGNSDGTTTSDAELYRELTDCIKDHSVIYELFLTIQENISTTCFLQFIATGLAQCTIGVYLLYVGLEPSKLLNAGLFFCALILEIFILCYYGDVYCQANDLLTEAIYECNWVEREEKFKKALMFLLQRSQKSSTIMAGNIIPVQMPTFVMVIKTAYSFFTVLNNVH